jgi:hypothetical protein
MKIGYENYEGEEDVWKDVTQNVCHIVVRVTEELKRVKESGKMEFYPFGLTAGAKATIDSLREIQTKPIDIYFAVVKTEVNDWFAGFPDPNLLKWDENPESYKHLHLDDEVIEIPHPIRLWNINELDYPSLLIDDLEYYEYDERLVLDFDGTGVSHINSKELIKTTFSGRPTFGVFINVESRLERNSDYSVDVIAHAKLVPPFYGVAKP